MTLDGGAPGAVVPCSECGRNLEPPLAFAPLTAPILADGETMADADVQEQSSTYCGECRASVLGPACQGCGQPTPRADGIVALDAHWHRHCLRCSRCQSLLGERYFAHAGAPFCRAHYLEVAGERCAACDHVVDGGLRALGRLWHEGCLKCTESGVPLGSGDAFLCEGKPVAAGVRENAAPRCHGCGKAATSHRLYAHGAVYHHDCFKCAHCRVHIGERKFVLHDGEPYLDGCYQKLFGASAGEAMRAQLHGALRRYAIHVPLQVALGAPGLARFRTQHEEVLPAVRRLLREHGIVGMSSFLFEPPAVSKPSLLLQMQIPATLQPDEALPHLLQADRVGQQWEALVAGVHDAAAARNNPWWGTLTQEMGASGGDEYATTDVVDS